MANERIRMVDVIPASPKRVYTAWLDSEQHAAMTGGKAAIDARIGGLHTAWGGYIEGKIVNLATNRLIVQTWRTTEFPEDAADSRLEIRLEDADDGQATRIVLIHSDIPEGQGGKYQSGWSENYFEPMKKYFQ